MKKYLKIFAFTFLTYFLMSMPVFAREMTTEELGEEAIKLKEDTQYIYVIGKYAFTSEHDLTQQDIMLAARSIEATADDGETNENNIYQKMNIQTIIPEYGNNFEITGWKSDKNLVGSAQLPTDKKFDIRYIDYTFYPEKSKAEINVNVDEDKFSTYKEVLSSKLNFTTEKFYGKEKLKLENGKLSGLLLKNTEVSLSPTDKDKYKDANYFFAYVLEVPEANEKTEIKVTNLNGTSTINWNSFDVQSSEGDKTPGVVILVPVSYENWQKNDENKKMTIVVDADGESGKEYEPTTYTVDLSGLTFQGNSKADLNIENYDVRVSDKDKATLNSWGYKHELNKELKFTAESGLTTKLTGKLIEQDLISADAFGDDKKDGYYFDFTFELPEGIDLSKVKISQLKDNNISNVHKTFQQSEYDENENLTILFRFAPETETGTKLYYSVDLDGEGEDYLPAIYTIDCSQVTFVKESKFTITGVNKTDADEDNTTSWDGWTEGEGYKTDFQVDAQDPHKVNVTGLLPIFNQEDFTDGSEFPKEALYYLAFKLQTELGTKTSSDINVEFLQDDEETLQKDNFKDEKTLYALKYLNTIAEDGSEITADKKKFDITLDWDGDEDKYAPYTITVDWSGLTLQYYSRGNFGNYDVVKSKDEENTEENKFLEGIKYNYEADSGVTVDIKEDPENGQIKKGLKGTIKEQTLDESAGFKDDNRGYFVPVKVSFPGKDKDGNTIDGLEKYAKTWTIILNTEDNKTKEYKPTGKEYEQGWVLVLFKIKEEGRDETDGSKTKTISYQIDFDGTPTKDGETGHEFLPEEYTISYDELSFVASNTVTFNYKDNKGKDQSEKVTIYEGEQIGNNLTGTDKETDYRKFDGWYSKEDSSKVETTRVLKEHEDISLEAHWKLNVETFVDDVVADLKSTNTTNSNDFTGKFELTQNEVDKNKITINIKSPNVPLKELAETSIPGTMAYILQKGEIEDITLTVGSHNQKFNSKYQANNGKEYTAESQRNLLDDDGKALKEEIVKGAKAIFDDELSNKEAQATLDKLEYDKKSFSIQIGNADKTVTLVDSEGNDLSQEENSAKKTYTFNFDADFAVVDQDETLGAKDINVALKNENNYSTIYIDGNYTLEDTLAIDKDITIKSVENSTDVRLASADKATMSVSSKDYVVDVKSGNVNIKNLKITGGTKAELKVEEGANVTVDNLDVSGINVADEVSEKDTIPNSAIVVNGTLTSSGLSNSGEKYAIPTIVVPKDSNGKVIANNLASRKGYARIKKGSTDADSDEIEKLYEGQYYYINNNNSIIYWVGFIDQEKDSSSPYDIIKAYYWNENVEVSKIGGYSVDVTPSKDSSKYFKYWYESGNTNNILKDGLSQDLFRPNTTTVFIAKYDVKD